MEPVRVVVRGPRATLRAPVAVAKSVSDLLSAERPGARFTAAYKAGKWDGVVRLMRGGAFPAGLLQRVLAHLAEFGVAPDVDDPTVADPPPLCDALAGIELRPHQLLGADVAVRERRVLIESPTGSGKSELGAEVIRRLGRRALWLTHRAELAVQTRERLLERLGGAVGLVGAGGDDWGQVVTVGTVQTLASRLKREDPRAAEFLGAVSVLVLDEAHHGAADTWALVHGACGAVEYQVGLTATAVSRDPLTDLRLEGVTGPKRVVAEAAALAAEGVLAVPVIRLIEPPAGSYPSYESVRDEVLPTWRRDPRPLAKLGVRLWDVTRRRGLLDNDARTRAIAARVARHYRGEWRPGGEKALVLTELVEHADALGAACLAAGAANTLVLTGNDSATDRRAALRRFREHGPPAVLVATPWFKEGMDVPEVDVGFIAGASAGEISVVQQFGRFLRPRVDKRTVAVYLCLDGRDPSERRDYLAQHTLAQLGAFRSRGWRVERLGPE